jgi:hypothetical protein
MSLDCRREPGKLRIVHAAPIIDRDGCDPRAIAGQDVPQIGQAGIGTVLLDQLRHAQPTAALAPGAGDFEHRQPDGDVAERDRAAAHPGERSIGSTLRTTPSRM